MRWLKISEAAPLMHCCERQARNRLVGMQARHPKRELLRDYRDPRNTSGKRAGRYMVNSEVLDELIREEADETIDDLTERVGSLETYWRIIKIRLRRLEKSESGRKNAELIEDLERRLRQLEAASGNDHTAIL